LQQVGFFRFRNGFPLVARSELLSDPKRPQFEEQGVNNAARRPQTSISSRIGVKLAAFSVAIEERPSAEPSEMVDLNRV